MIDNKLFVIERGSFMGTVVVVAVLVCVVGLILKGMHKDKKNGRSSCGGDCSSCGGRCHR